MITPTIISAGFALGAQDGGDLLYVVAVVLFGVIGAIVNKLKEKSAGPPLNRKLGEDAASEEPPPTPRPGPAQPTRPISRPLPLPRPVIRENPPTGRPPAPTRPPVRPPIRPAAPPVQRPSQPTRGPAVPAGKVATQIPRPQPARPPMKPTPAPPAAKQPSPPAQPVPAASAKEDAIPVGKVVKGQVVGRSPAQAGSSLMFGANLLAGIGRDELRRAIVLNEVLGPPLALRDE
jgi:hypothetical protein